MKLVAGLGSIDDYLEYVKAGADELFVGYIPMEYQLNGGLFTPLNRREVCFYNVQIGSESELEILKSLTEIQPAKITIAINGLCYKKEHYELIANVIEDCLRIGFDSFIVADYGLLIFLKEKGISDRINIHVSGEYGELNSYSVKELEKLGAKRLIYNRKIPISEMKLLAEQTHEIVEFEAFVLNEKCEFSGGFCNSLHIDEMPPICRMPYRLADDERCFLNCKTSSDGTDGSRDDYVCGSSGCGLCSLWRLKEAGVTHLKIVGRGAGSQDMIRDIKYVKRCLEIMDASRNEAEYISQMKRELFNGGCSNNCYYPEGE